MSDLRSTRRESLALALGAALAPTAAAAASQRIPFKHKIDFNDPVWNRDTLARVNGDIDPAKEKCGWLKGKVYGVRENEKIRALFGVEGFSFTRILRLPDGNYRKLLREIVFYRDLETGKILDTWKNPYTGETVKVVPIANDPFNTTITDRVTAPPAYGGLNTDKAPDRPLIMNWMVSPNGMLILHRDVDLYYANALQPDKWPRESSGVMNRVTERFMYAMKPEDVENPRLTNIPVVGTWARTTPWLPWMLMGQAPGHIDYMTTFTSPPNGLKDLPADLVAAGRSYGEKWLHAPETDYGPSYSSLENYAREQKPAPVPPGWTPPQPPPTPTALPGRTS